MKPLVAACVIASGLFVSSAAAQTSLTAMASLAVSEASVGDAVRFWVTVRNSGPGEALNVRIVGIDAPGFGFSLNGPCPCDSGDCFAAPRCAPLKSRLARDQQFTFWGDLIPASPVESRATWVLLRWDDRNGPTQEIVVPLGSLAASYSLARQGRALFDVVSDIALPLALGLFGFWFQRWERARTEQRAEEERVRSERLAKQEQMRAERIAAEEQRQTEIGATWREMLPLSHGYTLSHYMPVTASAVFAAQASRDARLFSERHKRAFYMWTLFWRRMHAQFAALNGFYFKDRCGEELASALLERCERLYYGQVDSPSRARRDVVLSALEPSGPASRFRAFSERWEAERANASVLGRELTDEFADFRRWVETRDCRTAIAVLSAFSAIVQLEMNRVYEPWYGKAEKMGMGSEGLEALLSVIPAVVAGGSVSEKDIRAYMEASGCPLPKRVTAPR